MEYRKINVMLPTRGRSQTLLPAHFKSAVECVGDPSKVKYTLLVDNGDEGTTDFLASLHVPFELAIIGQDGGSYPHLAEFYNTLYNRTPFNDADTLVSMVGDDMEWRTKGFEGLILDAVNERRGLAVVCCDDGYHHSRKRFVNEFTTRMIVDATHKPFMCPSFPADYIDDMWWMISERIGTTVWLDSVTLYHNHASRYPQNARDETCQRLRQMAGESRSHLSEMEPWVDMCVKNIQASGILCLK